jgi:hypothetical protein
MMKNDIINRFPDIKNEILITKTKSNSISVSKTRVN